MNRASALYQLFLLRLRDFFREPAAVLWVYGFPLFLAVTLGLAFARTGPDALLAPAEAPIAIYTELPPTESLSGEASALARHLKNHAMATEMVSREVGLAHLRSGKASLYIEPTPAQYEYYFDPMRQDCLLARYHVDDIVQRWKNTPTWKTVNHHASEPGDRYIDFLIPGLIGFNLLTTGLWGVGFVIVDLRVRKLLKRFLATPMRRGDFLLAIVGSRLLFLLPEALALVLAGAIFFGVPQRGHPVTLAIVLLLGGSAFIGISLLLACRAQSVETVSGLINVISMPLWMFSGTFFSAERFPAAAQPIIQLSPLTHLNEALRSVMLDGASLAQIAVQLGILAGWAAITLFLAIKWFRWS